MNEDPRVIRTKQLIIDSFLILLLEKDFQAISIKDITDRATVNRSTFYRHFTDKYALLDVIVCQMIDKKIMQSSKRHIGLNEETLPSVIYSFCDLVESLQNSFGRNYQTIIGLTEKKIKEFLIEVVLPYFHSSDEEKNYLNAMMFVTSVYSAACAWATEESELSRELFAQTIAPFVLGAIEGVRQSEMNYS